MPTSYNGFGTALVRASKKRTVDGHVQFEAVEALVAAYFPLVPYKVIHVLQGDSSIDEYHSITLSRGGRIIVKAYLSGWGNLLMFFAGLMTAIFAFATYTMERPFTRTDATFLLSGTAVLVFGVVLKFVWLRLDAKDEQIKDIIGVHALGTSDPIYWPEQIAIPFTNDLLTQHGATSLDEIAQKAMSTGEQSLAMLCTRVAMRNANDVRAKASFDQLLQLGRTHI